MPLASASAFPTITPREATTLHTPVVARRRDSDRLLAPDPTDHARITIIAIGRTIRCLRSRRRLSQEAFGFQAGLHRNFVGYLERGEGNPTTTVLVKLVLALDVPTTVLIAEFERCLTETYTEAHAQAVQA